MTADLLPQGESVELPGDHHMGSGDEAKATESMRNQVLVMSLESLTRSALLKQWFSMMARGWQFGSQATFGNVWRRFGLSELGGYY